MKLSLNWLREYLLALDRSAEEIADALTFTGVEVEGVQVHGAGIQKVVVAQIESFQQHPNADRLSVCQVLDGSKTPRQIVCGAKNFRAGDKVPLALPGAVLPDGTKIKASKLRGVESEGMLCSERELGFSDEASGLMILDPSAPVGVPLGDLFPPDTIFDLEITPDRPDLLSYIGLARELSIIFQIPGLKVPDPSAAAAAKSVSDPSQVRIDALEACPFAVFHEVRDVTVGPSPDWMRRRLEAAGLRSINNIVDITNYVMLETGKPIHAYDLSKLSLPVIVRFARAGEKLLALDGKTYELNQTHLVIADSEKAIGLGGVMGGEDTGVSSGTTTVLVESAYFDPGLIRRTSRGLGLISDASFRFERGVDPKSVLFAAQRAVQLIKEIAGGTASPSVLVAGQEPKNERKILFRLKRCTEILGSEIADAKLILERIGLAPADKDHWETPSYRLDLEREIDLIEEVSRYHGIQKLPGRLQGSPTTSSQIDIAHDDAILLRRKLAGLGLAEARTLVFLDEPSLRNSLRPLGETVKIRNPLAEDQQVLRPSLIPGLLRAAERNFNRGARSVALFELGQIFLAAGLSRHSEAAAETEESTKLAILLSGENAVPSWNQTSRSYDLFDAKGILETVYGASLQANRIAPNDLAALVCELVSNGRGIGHLGLVRPRQARELGAKGEVIVAEVELLAVAARSLFKLKPLERFPAVTRDIAFVSPRSTHWAEVIATLNSARESLLADVQVFDLFVDPSGQKIPADKKSLACSLTYRASDRTLTQDEVNEVHQRLKKRLVDELGVNLREG
ncbi:MAG TPA: phenylalanine--tRNA ligase subunit beta [Chthoniobacterales bacterium]|nr:phenylalanine--tRNA ligase subunit beta [Chthoniobacterales bacterium]